MNYLIYGTSYHLINEKIKEIVGSEKYNSLSLSDVSLKDVLEDASYHSMFEDKKIIVIKNFESIFESKKDNSSILELLLSYLKNPDANTILIFVSKDKISERAKINKSILSKLKIIETPVITKSYELTKIFADTLRKEGYGMSQNALNNFAIKCASNYDIAYMEFDKLKKIKKGDRLITEKDIEELVSNYNMTDIFGLKDAIINKTVNSALRMIDDAEMSKMEMVPIVVMLAKEYQILYNIKVLANKRLTNDQIGESLGGIHPYRVKILREAGNKYTVDELEKIILYLCKLDLKIVSEDNLGFDELRKFLLEL